MASAINPNIFDAQIQTLLRYIFDQPHSWPYVQSFPANPPPTPGTPTEITVADTTDASTFVALFESATGDLPPKTDGALTYNASTGALTATSFVGPLTGNSTGTHTGAVVGNVTGNVTGDVTGNVTGNVSGSSGSTTGNAATATALATARAINGVNFDGTAPITVTAAAGTLSGATLAAGVLASSLTSVGTLAALTVTAPIVGSVTGSAASATGNAATATALATPRAINGVAFDGTAAITVPAAAGTLTGATLAAGVTASSLTSVGTLAALTVTAPITGSISGSAGSATGNAATATALQTPRDINGVAFDGTADISITAAVAVKQTEIDFGTTPVESAEFVIVDATVSALSQILVSTAYEAPTGKDLDELEMDALDLKAAPGVGQFTLFARGMDGYVADTFKINYVND